MSNHNTNQAREQIQLKKTAPLPVSVEPWVAARVDRRTWEEMQAGKRALQKHQVELARARVAARKEDAK